MRVTHTYAKLVVSTAVYDEIRAKLLAAGYEHAHGIGLERDAREPTMSRVAG